MERVRIKVSQLGKPLSTKTDEFSLSHFFLSKARALGKNLCLKYCIMKLCRILTPNPIELKLRPQISTNWTLNTIQGGWTRLIQQKHLKLMCPQKVTIFKQITSFEQDLNFKSKNEFRI